MTKQEISVDLIKKLREETGAGIQDVKLALAETGGDIQKATDILRKKGAASAVKKSGRAAKQGLVESYIHGGGKVGVLLEVNCETDFVAATPDFRNFVHEVAMQVAAMAPRYVSRKDVPAEILAKEREIYSQSEAVAGKPAQVAEKIVAGKLEKYYEENCLLEQPSIKDPKIKISQMLTDLVGKLGENIVLARFDRYQLGEEQRD
jgi:elongation factor Ts